jgi:hypothetical protein
MGGYRQHTQLIHGQCGVDSTICGSLQAPPTGCIYKTVGCKISCDCPCLLLLQNSSNASRKAAVTSVSPVHIFALNQLTYSAMPLAAPLKYYIPLQRCEPTRYRLARHFLQTGPVAQLMLQYNLYSMHMLVSNAAAPRPGWSSCKNTVETQSNPIQMFHSRAVGMPNSTGDHFWIFIIYPRQWAFLCDRVSLPKAL